MTAHRVKYVCQRVEERTDYKVGVFATDYKPDATDDQEHVKVTPWAYLEVAIKPPEEKAAKGKATKKESPLDKVEVGDVCYADLTFEKPKAEEEHKKEAK